VYDVTLIYQQTVCFFMADLVSWFRSKLQSVAVMMSSRKCLLEDEIEQSLFEELTASDQSSSSDDDDSSGTNDLTVGEVIGSEYSDDESDDVQCTIVSIAPSASSATFTWEDMSNYVGQKENFFDNCGPQNEPYLLERKKMIKWYIKLFRSLLNNAILNCMVICCANSGQIKTDHFKFRVELVRALLIEHQSESVTKFQGHHSTDKNVPRLDERHFPERIPPTEIKGRPTNMCVMCCKINRRKETVFWCPECEAALCVEECFKLFHTNF